MAESVYPFSDAASLKSTDGLHTLPRDLFIDAALYPVGGQGRQFLSRVALNATSLKFTISDQSQELASGEYSLNSGSDIVYLTDSFLRPAGMLVLNPLRVGMISGWTNVVFDLPGAEFCSAAVTPVPDGGVRALQLEDAILTGDVWIVAGRGVVWVLDEGCPRLDIVGDPYYKRRKCQEAGQPFTEPACFRTLNGLRPGPGGNIAIRAGTQVPDNALRVEVRDNKLHFFFAGGRDSNG